MYFSIGVRRRYPKSRLAKEEKPKLHATVRCTRWEKGMKSRDRGVGAREKVNERG